jgi:hypothetical protein
MRAPRGTTWTMATLITTPRARAQRESTSHCAHRGLRIIQGRARDEIDTWLGRTGALPGAITLAPWLWGIALPATRSLGGSGHDSAIQANASMTPPQAMTRQRHVDVFQREHQNSAVHTRDRGELLTAACPPWKSRLHEGVRRDADVEVPLRGPAALAGGGWSGSEAEAWLESPAGGARRTLSQHRARANRSARPARTRRRGRRGGRGAPERRHT